MDDLAKIERVPSIEEINAVQRECARMPQVVPVMEHFFSNGMYCRKAFIKSGTLIVGKIHKEPHFFICASGRLKVWTDNFATVLNAGDVMCSEAGTKRMLLALTDVVGMNIHRTDSTDLAEIEKELIEDDPSALFDSGNQLRKPVIESNITPILPGGRK